MKTEKNINEIKKYATGSYDMTPFKKMFKMIKQLNGGLDINDHWTSEQISKVIKNKTDGQVR